MVKKFHVDLYSASSRFCKALLLFVLELNNNKKPLVNNILQQVNALLTIVYALLPIDAVFPALVDCFLIPEGHLRALVTPLRTPEDDLREIVTGLRTPEGDLRRRKLMPIS